jgi:hypothetical protein
MGYTGNCVPLEAYASGRAAMTRTAAQIRQMLEDGQYVALNEPCPTHTPDSPAVWTGHSDEEPGFVACVECGKNIGYLVHITYGEVKK